jgi:hypothetical protein
MSKAFNKEPEYDDNDELQDDGKRAMADVTIRTPAGEEPIEVLEIRFLEKRR